MQIYVSLYTWKFHTVMTLSFAVYLIHIREVSNLGTYMLKTVNKQLLDFCLCVKKILQHFLLNEYTLDIPLFVSPLFLSFEINKVFQAVI